MLRGGAFSRLFGGIAKTPLVVAGATAGTGGLVGLTHATPSILWKNGLTCKPVGGAVELKDVGSLGGNGFVLWDDGKLTGIPWAGGVKDVEKQVGTCFKR